MGRQDGGPRAAGRTFLGLPVDPVRSRTMSRIRGRDTGPERTLRRAVFALGGRYRLHAVGVPGRPDLSSRRARVAVFVDGCFWHGCPRHYRPPKTRRAFWRAKVRRNMERRDEVLALYPPGWRVIQLFECDLEADPGRWAREVADALKRHP